MKKAKLKKLIRFVGTSIVIYTLICIGLVFWPIELDTNTENYDYKVIENKSQPKFGQELWIPAKDSTLLFNRVYGESTETLMILIHGSGSDSRYLSDIANHLADQNIATVITPDMRGHGRNTGEKGHIDFIGQLEEDIEAIIDYSRKELGAKKIILAGHSSGGGFVLRFIGNPDNTKVDKAILLSPYLGHKAKTVKPNSGGWVQIALPRIIGLSMLNSIGFRSLNHLPVLYFNRPAHINDALQAPHYSFNMTLNFNPDNHLKEIENISIPSLVLVGEKDESFYPERFHEVFQPAQKFTQVHILKEVKHLGVVKNKETFKRLVDWLEM